MAGVPDYIEILFDGFLKSEEDLTGKVMRIRIAKEHHRFHDFIITRMVRQGDNSIIEFALERKAIQEFAKKGAEGHGQEI